jgi:phosphatidylglycerophosphatase A
MFLLKISTAIVTIGVGKIPKAPGTWGSLLAMLLWWAILPISLSLQLFLIFFSLIIGFIAIHYYEKKNHKHDSKEIVIDELVGMWITLFAAAHSLPVFFVGFLLFRIFDIWKPFPINWVDRHVKGAFGTMFDDLLAAVLSFICLNLLVSEGSLFAIFNF